MDSTIAIFRTMPSSEGNWFVVKSIKTSSDILKILMLKIEGVASPIEDALFRRRGNFHMFPVETADSH